MQYWPSVKSRPPVIQREFRGENRLDPFSIADGFATETVNLTNTKYPAITTRPGFSILGTFGKVLGFGVWKEQELHAVTADGKWRRLNSDGTWTELASGLDTAAEWTFTNFKGELTEISLIGSNGIANKIYNGSTVTDLTGVPAGAKYITQFADRLWCAVGNDLHFSAYRMAKDWTVVNQDDADSGDIVVESPDGETINSIQDGLTKLVVTKPSAIKTLFGYSPADYALRTVTLDTGQFNHKSGVTLDGWLYQLYDNGFYKYPGSGFPERDFALRIKTHFDSLTDEQKKDAVLGTDGSKLYLSMGSTLIEYDPKRDTYYSWNGVQATQFITMKGNVYIGDALGRIIRIGTATDDGGQPIAWKWVSKPFTGPSLAQFIRWFRMWTVIDLPAGSTFGVYLSKSQTGDDWVQSGTTITGNGSMERRAIYFPSNVIPNASLIRVKFAGTGPMTMYEFARDEETKPLR